MTVHLIIALSASFAIALVALLSLGERPDERAASSHLPQHARHSLSVRLGSPPVKAVASPRLSIDSLRHYSDSLYGFDVAIPAGWQRIITIDEPESGTLALDSGYAVGFESPRNHATDRYADYVMIEVLPGDASGAFESDGQERSAVIIDGRPATRDRVWLDSVALPDEELALVAYQASFAGLGYRVGLYAIGEQHEADTLGLAFDALLQTFTLREEPYQAY